MPRLRRRVLCAWTGLHVVIFVLALRAIVDRRFFGRLAPLVGKQPMTLPSGPSPIHLVLTCSATYAIGLLAVVNSTVQSASPATRARLRIHLVTTEGSEEAEILRQLDAQLGDVLKEHAITLLPHVAGPILKRQLAQAKVWGDYRSDALSKAGPLRSRRSLGALQKLTTSATANRLRSLLPTGHPAALHRKSHLPRPRRRCQEGPSAFVGRRRSGRPSHRGRSTLP